ncbi:MAG: A/G-specific adenine glycosylase [bacterium]|nr:A/G-specific adenine glycosylase [bacterium]
MSEVMLQQTQVERVLPLYKKFIKQFPTAKRLAAAPLSQVLKAWQGLGYNRRAKMLHQAAKEFQKLHNLSYRSKQGVNDIVSNLEKLPGVGPYTARAVAAFAYNQDVVFVETNIRTAVIHYFFSKKKKVSDKEIEKILAQALPKGLPAGRHGKAREWYSALMDYGAYLKRSGISHNMRSKKYVKQSKFSGSLREARGAIIREFTKGVRSRAHLINLLGPSRKAQMKTALNALITEGLVT